MLDSDLADLYQVTTGNLNKSVKRNIARFPKDFMFQLSATESAALRFQFGISNDARGGRRYRPYAFTEHGVAMLSGVLNSDRAIKMNLMIVRAFIKLREAFATSVDLTHRVGSLEDGQQKHSTIIKSVVQEIERLRSEPAVPTKWRIGYSL